MSILKLTKRITLVFIIIFFISLIFIGLLVVIDNKNTAYLNIDEHVAYQNNSYVIKNVNIVPMTKDTILQNKNVLIKDGIIQQVEDSLANIDYPIIDGTNKFLSPGLIDMHVHVWDKYDLGLFLANGVTAVRNMWGMPLHLRLKKEINENKIIAPTFFTSTPKLTGPNDNGIDKKQIESPEQAKKLIKKYKEQGYDLIKTYAGLPKNIFDAICEQAKNSNLRIGAHPSNLVDYDYHFQPIFETVEHTEEIVQTALNFNVTSNRIDSIARFYLKNNTSHTPTLSVFHNIIDILKQENNILKSKNAIYMNQAFIKLGSKNDLNRWKNDKKNDKNVLNRITNQHLEHLEILKRMQKMGVNIVCGTDAGIMFNAPGFSIHEELQFYKDAGLSNFEVLKTATINVSKVDKKYQNLGSVEMGKVANLLLLDENPLINLKTLKKPKIVFVKGRKLETSDLDLFKSKAKQRNNTIISAIRIIRGMLFN